MNAGGNLVAMRPDKAASAGLFGLTADSGTRSNVYLKGQQRRAGGSGDRRRDDLQYHGTADHYTLNGATAVAMQYSSATTATTCPAVTYARSINGGQAATHLRPRGLGRLRAPGESRLGRTGRDGVVEHPPQRDMFYSTWLTTAKVAIPQADEQQRRLANLITLMNIDRMPLPGGSGTCRGAKRPSWS